MIVGRCRPVGNRRPGWTGQDDRQGFVAFDGAIADHLDEQALLGHAGSEGQDTALGNDSPAR